MTREDWLNEGPLIQNYALPGLGKEDPRKVPKTMASMFSDGGETPSHEVSTDRLENMFEPSMGETGAF